LNKDEAHFVALLAKVACIQRDELLGNISEEELVGTKSSRGEHNHTALLASNPCRRMPNNLRLSRSDKLAHARGPHGADTAKAEAYFERALAVARGQQAKSWELRASVSLARRRRDRGRRAEARFDTLDRVARRHSSRASAQRSAQERLACFLEGKHCNAERQEEEPKSTGNRGGLKDEVGPRCIVDEQQHGEIRARRPI